MTCEDFPLLPTPSANFHEQDAETFLARREREREKRRNGNGFGLTLGMAVQLLPPSARESGGSTSPSTQPSEPCPPGSAKPTPTAAPSSSATGPEPPCCPTCGKSTQDSDPSTCCTPATRASRSHRQDAGSEKKTPGIFGRPSHEPFAFYDPDSSCWRTSQATLLSDSTPCSLTLPKRGSLHGGALYEQPTWEPRTDAPGSLSLPTPQAADGSGGRITADPETLRTGKRPSGTKAGKPLATAEAQLPTPTSRDHKGRNQRDDATCLPGAVALLPTSIGDDASNVTRESGNYQSLTRTAVSLGASTSPPSDAGNTPSDGQPPGQLTIEDA